MIMTKQRKMIYGYFLEHPEYHPTAEEIYDYVKQSNPSIGIATVYRNLKLLVEQGFIRELNLEKQGVRYDLLEHEHYHFICESCGSITNFGIDTLHHIDEEVELQTHGKITRKNLIFHGLCEQCLLKDKANR